MKKKIFIVAILFVALSRVWGQNAGSKGIPLIGETAPSFTAESTMGTIHFPEDYMSKWKILFSHPADFTPVCTSEILDLAAMQEDFSKLNTQIVVISADNLDTHTEWVQSMESLNYKSRETAKIKFPLISDKSLEISREYGMIHPSTNSTKDVRGVFIIDPKNTIRAFFFYPMNIGRSMEEIKRTVIALQTADNKNILTPSGWQPGGDVLVPYTKYTSDQEELAKRDNPDLYKITWYMWGMKLK